MTQSTDMADADAATGGQPPLQALVEEYLTALREQQLDKCLSLFAEDATIEFQAGVFKGPAAIEEWHRDRFAAGFEIVDVERMTVDGDTVTVEAAIASARLRAWKINRLSGRATIGFEKGRIKEARLTPKLYNPFEGW
jgi:uncharacterized protein (TIGR02246 family)